VRLGVVLLDDVILDLAEAVVDLGLVAVLILLGDAAEEDAAVERLVVLAVAEALELQQEICVLALGL